jgi:hypothetical protein
MIKCKCGKVQLLDTNQREYVMGVRHTYNLCKPTLREVADQISTLQSELINLKRQLQQAYATIDHLNECLKR